MIKKLLLALCIGTSLQAEIVRFPYEDILTKMYLDVNVSDTPRILVQQIAIEYIEWFQKVNELVATKEDTIYVTRLAHMFGEVSISYHYGN